MVDKFSIKSDTKTRSGDSASRGVTGKDAGPSALPILVAEGRGTVLLHRPASSRGHENIVVSPQTDANDLKQRMCTLLENRPEVVVWIKSWNAIQCAYLMAVYRMETLW